MLIQDFLNSLDIVHYEDMKTASVQYHDGQNMLYDIVGRNNGKRPKKERYFEKVNNTDNEIELTQLS